MVGSVCVLVGGISQLVLLIRVTIRWLVGWLVVALVVCCAVSCFGHVLTVYLTAHSIASLWRRRCAQKLLGQHFDAEEAKKMLEMADKGGDGSVNVDEFLAMAAEMSESMRKNAEPPSSK